MRRETSVRAQVRDELVADLAGVSERVLHAVRSEIPAYRTLTDAQLQEVEAIAVWGITRVLDAWVQEQQLTGEDLRRFRGIGAARALDGRPLPVVLRAYRVAGNCVTDLIAERAVSRLSAQDALALARLWMTSIDALSEALYEGHRAAAERLESDRDSALADLLGDLLGGRQATRTALAERSRQLGLTLPSDPVLVVAAPTSADSADSSSSSSSHLADWDRLVLTALHASDLPAEGRHLHALHESHGVALLPHGARAALAGAVAAGGWRAVALTGLELSGVSRGHRLAVQVLRQAPPRAFAVRPVLEDLDAAVLAVLSGHPDPPATPQELLRQALDGQAVVRAGLEAFLATGNAVAAAERLGCHAQTMRYRLRRLRTLTGRDVSDPWDRFVLEAASLATPAQP